MCPLCVVLAAFFPLAAAASYWDKLGGFFARGRHTDTSKLEPRDARFWGKRAIHSQKI